MQMQLATMLLAQSLDVNPRAATIRATLLLLLIPAIVGGIISLVNSPKVNDISEKLEGWTRKQQRIVSAKKGFFWKWIVYPPVLVIVKLCDWTDSLTNRGLKNGIRVAAALYVLGLWLQLLVSAFMFVLDLICVSVSVVIVFWIIGHMLGGKSEPSESGRQATSGGAKFMSFSKECDRCGSKDHATEDCPHGAFSKQCDRCGAKNHATEDCPHGAFSKQCDRCGSKDHATKDCPH